MERNGRPSTPLLRTRRVERGPALVQDGNVRWAATASSARESADLVDTEPKASREVPLLGEVHEVIADGRRRLRAGSRLLAAGTAFDELPSVNGKRAPAMNAALRHRRECAGEAR